MAKFEPKVTTPLALELAPAPVVELEVEPDPHAASAANAAAPIVPMSSVRLLMGLDAKDEMKADGTEPEFGSEFWLDTTPPGNPYASTLTGDGRCCTGLASEAVECARRCYALHETVDQATAQEVRSS